MLFQKLKKKQQSNIYNSLEDLSIWNWDKANKTGDLNYIIQDGTPSTEQLNEAWIMLNNEHLERYGISDLYQKILDKKTQLCNEQIDYIQTNDRVLLNSINLTEAEIKRLESEGTDTDLYAILPVLEKEQGRNLDPKEISVVKFYSYINLIKQRNEQSN